MQKEKTVSPLQENKMGVMPIGKLLFNMAAPMILSMLVQALYNIVDSIYVSQISESAVTALSLAFPIQNIQIGFATGVAVGVNSLLSKSLGEGNRERANRAAGNGIFLILVGCVLFMLFGAFGSRLFYEIQSDVAETFGACCIGHTGRTYVDDHGAGLHHVCREKSRPADGGDDDVGSEALFAQALTAAVAYGYGGVAILFLHHELRHGLAHDVASAEHHAFFARGLDVVTTQQFENALGGGRNVTGQTDGHAAHVDGVEAVHVFAIVDGFNHLLF